MWWEAGGFRRERAWPEDLRMERRASGGSAQEEAMGRERLDVTRSVCQKRLVRFKWQPKGGDSFRRPGWDPGSRRRALADANGHETTPDRLRQARNGGEKEKCYGRNTRAQTDAWAGRREDGAAVRPRWPEYDGHS